MPRLCSLEHCRRPTPKYSRSLCGAHQSLKQRGVPDWETRVVKTQRRVTGKCLVCPAAAKRNGQHGVLCMQHYNLERYRLSEGAPALTEDWVPSRRSASRPRTWDRIAERIEEEIRAVREREAKEVRRPDPWARPGAWSGW